MMFGQGQGNIDLDYSYTFIYSFSLLYQPTFFAKFDITVKQLKVNLWLSFEQTIVGLCPDATYQVSLK